jgi:glycosyltransferase involved in cell wall biosynthesis
MGFSNQEIREGGKAFSPRSPKTTAINEDVNTLADPAPIDVSVVIPTFRRARELDGAIRSALAQRGAAVEVFVVDDCPEGSARSVVERIADPRVSYFRNPHPTGGYPSMVRNLGWPRANGRFVHFLDDDDLVPPDHYASAIDAFLTRPSVGVLFGRIEPFGDCSDEQLLDEQRYFAEAARVAKLCARFGTWLALTSRMLFGNPPLVCSAALVRRECVVAVGGFDPSIRLMEDADFFVRVIRQFGAGFLDRPTLHYRIGFPSLMHAPLAEPRQLQRQRDGRRRMRASYLRVHGAAEFFTLALIAKILLALSAISSRFPGFGGGTR